MPRTDTNANRYADADGHAYADRHAYAHQHADAYDHADAHALPPEGCPTPTPTPTATPPPEADFIVDSTTDANDISQGNGVCATAVGECTLRAAIQEANSLPGVQVIGVPAGVYFLSKGQLVISTEMTVIGAGAATTAIDGAGLFQVFEITVSATAEISDLTITHGLATADYKAGGIENWGILMLNNTIVSANTATSDYSAAGIRSPRNILTLNNSLVSGNIATGEYSVGGIETFQSGVLTLNGSTISDNTASGPYGTGGIEIFQSAKMTINDSTISGNSATNHHSVGGIQSFQSADVTINNSTVSGNVGGVGNQVTGGIETYQYAMLTVSNSTISGNTSSGNPLSDSFGGGIHAFQFATVVLKNNIIADNSPDDCSGKGMTSFGHNLDSDGTCDLTGTGDISNANPLLGPLANNGGPTMTQALLAGSPAIDAVSSGCPPPSTDQRGVFRPQGSACDIGAFEWCSVSDCPPPTATPTPTATATPDLTDTDEDGCPDQRENGPDEMLGGMRDMQNPSDYYDVAGGGGAPPDQIIDLANDILGVIQHYAPTGTEVEYDVDFDRGPSTGPDAWNMTAADGVIDLSNDILGVVQQYQHSCQ